MCSESCLRRSYFPSVNKTTLKIRGFICFWTKNSSFVFWIFTSFSGLVAMFHNYPTMPILMPSTENIRSNWGKVSSIKFGSWRFGFSRFLLYIKNTRRLRSKITDGIWSSIWHFDLSVITFNLNCTMRN